MIKAQILIEHLIKVTFNVKALRSIKEWMDICEIRKYILIS